MSDIRQFLRYEIPGYLLFIYTFLLILPLLNPSVIKSLLPELLKISISGFIIAIPIGWLLYQIFSDYVIEKHYSKKSVKLIKKWIEEKNLKLLPNYWYGELLYVILFSSNNENKDIPFDSQLAAETLRSYWTHYEARWIVAIPVVVISTLLAISAILAGMIVDPSLFNINNIWISIIIYMIICIISCSICQTLDRIWNEINALEVIFVSLRKNQIDGIINTIYKENNFDKTSEEKGKI
jgi:hypothetical protein